MTESANRTLEVGDLTPGCTVSGAFSECYFDPTSFEVYEFSGVGNGTPMMAFHGRHCYLGKVPLCLADSTPLEDAVRAMAPRFAAIADGYDEAWDGNNTRGSLTEGAREVLNSIQEEWASIVEDLPSYWEAGEYFAATEREEAEEILEKGVTKWADDEIEYGLDNNAHLKRDEVLAAGYDILESEADFREDSDDEDDVAFVEAARRILADR